MTTYHQSLHYYFSKIGNSVHSSVPQSHTEDDNEVIRKYFSENKAGEQAEEKNLTTQNPEIAEKMKQRLLAWKATLPKKVARTGKYRHQY